MDQRRHLASFVTKFRPIIPHGSRGVKGTAGEDFGLVARLVDMRRHLLVVLLVLAVLALALSGAALQALRGERPILLGGW
jgi:hypothetical protein